MYEFIPLDVKRNCIKLIEDGSSYKEVYDEYFKKQFSNPRTFNTFKSLIPRWKELNLLNDYTLDCGTYNGFIPHDATVQVSKDGEIVQAWIKQKASDFDPSDFLKALREEVKPYPVKTTVREDSSDMLEIPLFDMHWGIAFIDHYQAVLDEILELIRHHRWSKIVIPFGQDFFHNDSVANGVTTKGTVIEKVDMQRAVKEGRTFIYAIIDAAIENSNEVKIIYTPGNHDRSISWMFMQVLLERYGPEIVDDTMSYRKVITFGKNSIMITHGDSKMATAKNLASIFPVSFPEEFASSSIREIHCGHLHHEMESDIFGIMVRRLSSGNKTDEWSDRECFVGTHKRFMLFVFDSFKLKSIVYIGGGA